MIARRTVHHCASLQLPSGLVRAERQPGDPPEVVEIWWWLLLDSWVVALEG
jgi:hypothetical protein